LVRSLRFHSGEIKFEKQDCHFGAHRNVASAKGEECES
jgi:hypothetical protein